MNIILSLPTSKEKKREIKENKKKGKKAIAQKSFNKTTQAKCKKRNELYLFSKVGTNSP